MSRQKGRFLASEGDAWFDRNPKHIDSKNDPVIRALTDLGNTPRVALEVGCGAGARLAALHAMYGSQCYGIEPSAKAVEYANRTHPELHIEIGTAVELPFETCKFDLIIFGFRLCWCDPIDHFSIAQATDRVLAEGGFVIIHDFAPLQPFKNAYAPSPELFTYKMSWARMFTWHPRYQTISRRYFEHREPWSFSPDERATVETLRKDSTLAFPLNPWPKE